jgi:hypothetical protein
MDVVYFEQRHRACCVLLEEFEVRIARCHDLDRVAIDGRELHRRGLVELLLQAHGGLQEVDPLPRTALSPRPPSGRS